MQLTVLLDMNINYIVNCWVLEVSSELSECTEDEMKTFNEDILCSHGISTISIYN